MHASGSPAETGKWTDYTTREIWLVATATWGYVLPAFVGIWLSLSAKYLKTILANFALYIHLYWHKETPTSPESTPLLALPESPAQTSKLEKARKRAKVLAKVYKDGGGVRDFCYVLCFDKDLSPKYRGLLCLFVFFLSLAMVGFIILGVYVARIKANGPAILHSEKCGLWVFDRHSGGDEAASRAGIRDLKKETRAGEYAQNCYGTPDMFDAIQCNFLYRSRLSFSPAQYTTDCPFQNEICSQNQTVTFETDTIDASELGINSPHSPKFHRRTSCTPLSMEYPFIQNQTHNGTTTYYYYYGEKPLHDPPLNYTYTTTGDPYDRLAPAYDVYAYHSGSTPTATSYWKPRAELIHPDFSTLTLIFVSSLRISYKKWSDDPIFPADKEVFLPGERKPWFRNSDPRARPLACINYIEVCLADGKTCWPMNADQPPDAVTPPEFWLMFASLRRTDIYNAIEKRLGRGLIAQSKVSQFFSEALGDQHWVDEVERLVATSHAMTQINAWSIASGEDSVHEGRDGYVLITPEEKYGNLCRMFKYNPPGYASIYFEPFIGILLTFPIIFILSRKWPLWPWKNETSNSVEVEPQLSDAGGVGQEELIPQSADPAPTGSETEVTRTEAGSEPLDARAVGQEEPTSEPAATAATGSHTEETTTGEVGRAEPSGPSSASVALGSGQEPPTPRPTEMVVSQNTETGGATTGIPTDTSADVEWEPLLIEKIIQLLVFLVWPWPLKAYEWLRYSSIAIWRE